MCNDPHSIRTGLSLDPWEIGELEARASVPLRQVVPTIPSIFAASPPDNQTPSNECQSRQFVGVSRMSLLTSPFASTAMVRSTWSLPEAKRARFQFQRARWFHPPEGSVALQEVAVA